MMKKSMAAACSTVLAATGLAFTATPARADADLVGTVTRNAADTLRPAALVSGKVRQSMDAAMAEYIDYGARRGRNLDSSGVNAFVDPSSSVILTVGSGEAVDGLDVGTVEGVTAGVGVRTHESGSGDSTAAAAPVIGFAGGPSYSSYTMSNSGWHQVSQANDGDIVIDGTTNYVKSWFWKFELPEGKESGSFSSSMRTGSDFWAYARRGEGDAKTSGTDLVDLTARSRPWGGTSQNFRNMLNYAPAGAQVGCADGGSVSLSYGPASVKIPLGQCSAVAGVAETGSIYEFGVDYSGRTKAAISIEAIASYRVKEGYVPSFADYIWATFDPGTFSNNRDVKWNDTGW